MSLIEESVEGVNFINEASSGEELPKEIVGFLEGELEECADSELDEWNWTDPEEIESKSRDGFWAWTDGGVEVRAWQSVEYMVGSGTAPKAIDKAVNDFADMAYSEAKEQFISNHPELANVDFDIDYNSLYDQDKGDLAEELSELESEYMYDIIYEAKIGAYYYKDENFHNPIGKGVDAVSIFAELALEGGKRNASSHEINLAVDFSSDKGIKKAEKAIAKAITKVIKKVY